MEKQKINIFFYVAVAVFGMALNWLVENASNFKEGVLSTENVKYDGVWFTFLFFYLIIVILNWIGHKRNITFNKGITAISIIVILIGILMMISDLDNEHYSFWIYFIETFPAFLIILILHKSQVKWIILTTGIVLLFLTLPFHYILSRDKIFLKDSFTFKNTFITEKDINDIITRQNEASFLEKIAINNDPLMKKLLQEGIITETDK